MDKDRPRNVMRNPYRDLGRGEKTRAIVSYSQLTDSLKDRIIATDPTERELLEMIVVQSKILVLHLMAMSDESITEDDIEWP
ncbi:hypothetical protein LCGC14_0861600 [marine sediment metagenome]|uniref:Uncharacterized protein n=1 Tax=marine sediment metagenome TaxID=412755 RepID=A0A0F9RRX3_9ZZZZ